MLHIIFPYNTLGYSVSIEEETATRPAGKKAVLKPAQNRYALSTISMTYTGRSRSGVDHEKKHSITCWAKLITSELTETRAMALLHTKEKKMIKGAGIVAGIIVCLVFVTSCTIPSVSRVGNDFDQTKQEAIVKGKTNKQELISLLGQPQDKTLDSQAKEKWIYLYSESNVRFNPWNNSAAGDVRTKKLEVMFDEDVVANYVYSDSTVPAEAQRR